MNKKIIIAAVLSMFAISPVNESFAMERFDSESDELSIIEGQNSKKEESIDSKEHKKHGEKSHHKGKKKGKKKHKVGKKHNKHKQRKHSNGDNKKEKVTQDKKKDGYKD